jgi:hypothetical protein
VTITLGWWALPTLVTLAVWAYAILWPIPNARGDYNFGAAFTFLARLVLAVVVTKGAWLVYFIGLAVLP